MRLGIAATALEPAKDHRYAGVARVAFGLCDALARRAGPDLQIELFVLPGFDPPKEWTASGHVRVHRMGRAYTKWTILLGGLAALRCQADFFLSTDQIVPWYGPTPVGLFVHDLFPLTHPEWFRPEHAAAFAKTLPRSVRRSRLLFANSNATRQATMARFGIPSERIVTLPIGPGNALHAVEPTSVSDADLVRMGVPFSRFLFTLSTLEPRKNLPRLFEALSLLQDREVGLVVGGGRGWKNEGLEERLREMGVAERVHFMGYVDDGDLPALFARCELYVCPSLDEGFGMPVLEAMIAGAPVATSHAPALLEVAGDAPACVFDAENARSMADALDGALCQPQRREEWRRLGMERAARFGWARTAQEAVDAIRRTLERNR